MVFDRISDALGGNGSETEDEFDGVVAEAMEEHRVLKQEYGSDDFFQERVRKIIEEEGVSVENLEVRQGAQGKKLGRGVKILGAVAEGLAVKTIVEQGISKIEQDIRDSEEIIETQDAELYQAEDRIEELEIRVEDMLEKELEDIGSVSGLESSISTIEENAESLTSMLEQNSLKQMEGDQMTRLVQQLNTIIEEVKQVKRHQEIESLEYKVQQDHVSGQIFNQLGSEALSLAENVVEIEEELQNLEEAINLVSESLNLVESHSEIWMHNENIQTLNREQQLAIITILEEDSRLDRLSDFTGFDKQAFLSQLSSKNPGDLISESQEFRDYEVSNFESQLQDVESEVESLEQNNSELESQLQQIKGNAAEIIEELEQIEERIENLKKPSQNLVNALETEISEIDDIINSLNRYDEMKGENKISPSVKMEKLKSANKENAQKGGEGVFQETEQLLQSITGDLEELISVLASIEEELFKDENSVKSAMEKINSINMQKA